MRLSVIIPTLGRPDLLREAIESVLAADPPPSELIVVDGDPNHSARPVVDTFHGGKTDLVYFPTVPSVTRQRNIGIRAARSDVVVFLDDDVAVDPLLFAVLAEAFGDPGLVGATGHVAEERSHQFMSHHSTARRWLLGNGAQGTFTRFGYPRYVLDLAQEHDVEVMPGCLMSVRTDVAREVLFDEALTGYALAEDEDFSYRLSRLGRIRFLPKAVVKHKKSGFSSSNPRELNRKVVVNRAYIFRKNFKQTPLARLQFSLLILMLVMHRVLNREWSAARGLFDGIVEAWHPRTAAPR
jgi:GT2 family glycosyltransferase